MKFTYEQLQAILRALDMAAERYTVDASFARRHNRLDVALSLEQSAHDAKDLIALIQANRGRA